MMKKKILPKLAFVTPFFPLRTGVADYARELFLLLNSHFEITLVCDDTYDVSSFNMFEGGVIKASNFVNKKELHDNVIYHIGNSSFHSYIEAIIERIPGVVVLHDFFLAESALDKFIKTNSIKSFVDLILNCHGTYALWNSGSEDLVTKSKQYPCNLQYLRNATNIIVHSNHCLDLARQWLPEFVEKKMRVVPHLKKVAVNHEFSEKISIRQRFGLAENVFLVATFGFGGSLKGHQEIIVTWMNSSFATNQHAMLFIVGEYSDLNYLKRMKSLIDICGGSTNIKFLGYVSSTDYIDILSITDLAIQLRLESRGESSGTVLDCLANSIPTIVSDIGSFAEIPDDVVWKVSNGEYLSAQLNAALETLYADDQLRSSYGSAAVNYISVHHNPSVVTDLYLETINSSSNDSVSDTCCDHVQKSNPTIFIDITAIYYCDLKTGIQRVTRSLLNEFLSKNKSGYNIEPIYLDHNGSFRFARSFVLNLLGVFIDNDFDNIIEPVSGDIFFGLDMHPSTTLSLGPLFDDWRSRGVKINFLLHDLLPIRYSKWFPAKELPFFKGWLNTVVSCSDGIVAVSSASANDLINWLQSLPIAIRPAKKIKIGWVHNGSDIAGSVPTFGLPDDGLKFLSRMSKRKSFLMVSTIEPRKGHKQVLDAFDLLWNQGLDVDLVLVGKQGWMVDHIVSFIKAHPRLNKNLFWLEGITDEYLQEIYKYSHALIAASEGEGFGLPIVEAAAHKVNVIARDIPVFREVGGAGVDYFTSSDAESLASYLREWLEIPETRRADPSKIKRISWNQCAEAVWTFIINQDLSGSHITTINPQCLLGEMIDPHKSA